jgi:cell division transport system permease protein
LVSFSSVAKRYPGGQEALRDVSFVIGEGELAFITGRSGAGKSTLLKLIPAIERPTSGSVIVKGQNIGALKRAAIPYLRRNLGLVFQDQKLLYDRSVYDNAMLPLAFSGHAPKEAGRRVRAALDKVGRRAATPRDRARGGEPALAPDRRRADRQPRRRIGRPHPRDLRRLQPGRRHRAHRHPRPGPGRALWQAHPASRAGAHRVRAWLRQHRHAFGQALRRFTKAAGLASALVIGIALSLPAGGYALLESLRAIAARLTLEPQISLFLQPEAKRADAEALGKRLRADPRVAKLRFVPREDALRELQMVEGFPELIAALGRNPLPDAFVLSTNGAAVDALAADLAKLPGVAHVQADAVWARRLAALAGIARLGLWLLAGLLGTGLVAVTFNTIRLQILTQRDEIEVSKLIGATDAFIRRPFYYLGLLQGLAGGAVAVGIVVAALALLNREVSVLAESYGSSFRFAFLPTGDALAVVLFASLLGWLGAHLSVNRHLREIEPR